MWYHSHMIVKLEHSRSYTPPIVLSESARWIDQSVCETYQRLSQISKVGGVARDCVAELDDIFLECSKKGWDGYDAKPIDFHTLAWARQLVACFPFGLEKPDIIPSPDGNISFEWSRTPTRLISISITASGQMIYATLNGLEDRFCGVTPFRDSFPQKLYNRIQEILRAPSFASL